MPSPSNVVSSAPLAVRRITTPARAAQWGIDTGYVAVPSVPHVSLTHIDGDTHLDMVLGAAGAGLYGPDQNGPGEVQVLLGLGDGHFTGVPAFGNTARTLADWTADGVPDLLELGPGSIRLLQGGTGGNFVSAAWTAVNFPTFPELPQEYLAIDLDDDGRNDLLAIHPDAFAPSTSMRWTRLIGNDDSNLFHMRTNLRFGCTILRHYLDIEKGDLYRALGRYNGSLGKPEYPNMVRAVWEREWGWGPRVIGPR